jgi:prophage regulatory protein
MSHKFLRLSAVKNLTGLSRSTIYLRISEKKFPKPINLGGRAVAWLEWDIDAWIEKRIKESRQLEKRGI